MGETEIMRESDIQCEGQTGYREEKVGRQEAVLERQIQRRTPMGWGMESHKVES